MFKKSANQKEACVKKFHNAKMSNSNHSPTDQPSTSSSNQQPVVRISVDLGNVGINSARHTTLQHISAKAEELLN
jgi:hypothetical protein